MSFDKRSKKKKGVGQGLEWDWMGWDGAKHVGGDLWVLAVFLFLPLSRVCRLFSTVWFCICHLSLVCFLFFWFGKSLLGGHLVQDTSRRLCPRLVFFCACMCVTPVKKICHWREDLVL